MTLLMEKFLALVAWAEGTSTAPGTSNDGYDVIVGGEGAPHQFFDDYGFHPFERGRPPVLVRPGLYSTASGRYQLMLHWWLAYKKELGLADFGPASQDAVAMRQVQERHGDVALARGDVRGAILACGNVWASLPGNAYDQPSRSMEDLLARWNEL